MKDFEIENWKLKIASYVDNLLKNSGFQYDLESEKMEKIVNDLMQDKKIFECIDWLDVLIVNACTKNGIIF